MYVDAGRWGVEVHALRLSSFVVRFRSYFTQQKSVARFKQLYKIFVFTGAEAVKLKMYRILLLWMMWHCSRKENCEVC